MNSDDAGDRGRTMTPGIRSALLAGCALGAIGITFARNSVAIAVPEAAWLGAPSAAQALTWLRALAGLGILNLAAWGIGAAALHWLPAARDPDVRVPAQLGLGFAALAVAVLGMAAIHALLPWALGGLLAAACAAALIAEAPRRHERWRAARRALHGRGPQALLVAALLAAPGLAAFGPDPGWDALTYHLALPERYLFSNAIVVTPYSVFSTFPHATAMLYLLAQWLDGSALAQLLHLEFGVLTAGLAWRSARDASPRAGWLALAALAACPLFVWELEVAYADLSAALYTLLAVRMLYGTHTAHGGRQLVAAGLFAGAAAACRYPSWPLLPVLLACLWLPGSPVAAGTRARLRASIAFGIAAWVPLAPWLLRNLFFTGNPVAPVLQSVFAAPGCEYFAPLAVEQNAAFVRAIGMGRGLLDLLALPWNLSFEARSGDYAAFGYRIGVLYAVGLVAALLARRGSERPSAAALWWPAGALTLVWFFTAQEPRYLLPALVLVAIGGACAADTLIPQGIRGRAWLALPLLAVAHTQLPILASLPQRYAVAAGRVEANEPAAARMGRRLQGELDPDARVVLFFEPRSHYFAGIDYVPYHLGDGSPLLIELHAAVEAETLPEFFASLGATHLLLETRLRPITMPSFTRDYTRETFTADVRALERFLASRATRELEEGSLALYHLENES